MSESKIKDDSSGCGCCGRRKKKAPKYQVSGTESAAAETAAANLGLSKRDQEHVTKALQAEMERRQRWGVLLKSKGLSTGAPSIEDVLGGVSPPESPGSKSISATDTDTTDAESGSKMNKKRQDWIKKMQRGRQSKKTKRKKKKKTDQVEEQPETLTIEADQAEEMASHAFMKMLQKVLVKAKEEQEANANKSPSEMTPEQLVKLRRADPAAWDELVNANSIASFGLAKPTSADEKRARKLLRKAGKRKRASRRGKRITFDDKTTVAKIPAGEDFEDKEGAEFHSDKVSYDPDVLKKQ